ncbi:hypothetical protein C1X59_30085, partial [Pseudomonas sp. FW215-R2]|uniref:hypothetical protein n=1 Tax=Pseudomonas sp. FW215-R2 TaxID=2070615 RepID=UPI000CB95447
MIDPIKNLRGGEQSRKSAIDQTACRSAPVIDTIAKAIAIEAVAIMTQADPIQPDCDAVIAISDELIAADGRID